MPLRRRWPTPSRAATTPHRPSRAPLPTRQQATSFNQSLSIDTSSVTDMSAMFMVRSTRALTPSLQSGLPPACRCRLRRRWPTQALPRFTRAALAPHCMPALLSTRQQAYAFNQPLSLDTSSVTDMSQMFFVRPAYTALRPGYGPTPQAPVRPSPACYLRRHRPTRPPCLLAHTRPTHASPRIAYPPSDPAGSGCVQPAAELRRFQHHR